jgi:hypothetical protein
VLALASSDVCGAAAVNTGEAFLSRVDHAELAAIGGRYSGIGVSGVGATRLTLAKGFGVAGEPATLTLGDRERRTRHPIPWEQLVQLVGLGLSRDDMLEHVGEPRHGVYVVELGSLH